MMMMRPWLQLLANARLRHIELRFVSWNFSQMLLLTILILLQV
jgi:hypothetical protein